MDVVLFVADGRHDLGLQFVEEVSFDGLIPAALSPHLNLNLIYNQPQMNFLLKWGRQYQKCQQHQQEVTSVCFQQKCHQRLLCRDCLKRHETHETSRYEQYKQMFQRVENHIKIRENLEHLLKTYRETAIAVLDKHFKEMSSNIFRVINDRYCSNKFLQIEKLYKSKGDYIPLVRQCKENPPQNMYREIESLLIEKQKQVKKTLSKLQVSFDIRSIAVQKLEQYPFNQRQSKLKSILPFKCDLKLRFKASQNEYLSKKMYAVNIRGPILLYVQSYKNRHFGGYSSVMFPKYDEDTMPMYNNIDSFLFSLDHRERLLLKEEFRKFAIKGGTHFGFGQGDLLIADECHKGNISWAEIGRTYRQPSNFKGLLNQWLAGASYFRVVEYEIYSVEIKRQK